MSLSSTVLLVKVLTGSFIHSNKAFSSKSHFSKSKDCFLMTYSPNLSFRHIQSRLLAYLKTISKVIVSVHIDITCNLLDFLTD